MLETVASPEELDAIWEGFVDDDSEDKEEEDRFACTDQGTAFAGRSSQPGLSG